MRIRFQEIGGFVPVFKGCELDTDTMSAADAARLQVLIEESGILTVTAGSVSSARDLALYVFTLDTGEGSREVSFDQLSVPASVKPLLAFLLDRSRDLLP